MMEWRLYPKFLPYKSGYYAVYIERYDIGRDLEKIPLPDETAFAYWSNENKSFGSRLKGEFRFVGGIRFVGWRKLTKKEKRNLVAVLI